MKKKLLCIALLAGYLLSCKQEKTTNETATNQGISVLAEANPEWQFEQLRLAPIVADAAFIQDNVNAASLINLGDALQQHRFRITERKPFGRQQDPGAVNQLTVQNKTEDAVFLMAGDIVQGGNQDRVIAEDEVVAARSLHNIPVFCVEPNRWTPREDQVKSKNYAFGGYYNVASRSVRLAAMIDHDQQAVWKHVGEITELHHATSTSGAYAALEQSADFTQKRDQYLRFFKDKFAAVPSMVGVVVINNGAIVGADVFGRPELFANKFDALLHSYITDALSSQEAKDQDGAAADLTRYTDLLRYKLRSEKKLKLEYNGALVHFASF